MLSGLPGGATAVLAAAAEALPFGVAIADPHGILTWVNAAYARLSSGTPDELLGQSAGEFPWDALSHAALSSEPWRGEAISRRKTGEAWSGEHTITTLRDPAGEVAGFWIVLRDATKLKPPSGLPYEAEDNLSALIESTDDLVWSVDLNFGLLTFNRAMREYFERNFGIRAAIGMRPEDLMPPARASLWRPMYERALIGEGTFRGEYALVDGRTLELSIGPIRHHGRTSGVSVFGKDITGRRAAEKALREARQERQQTEQRYRTLFDSMQEGVAIHKLVHTNGTPENYILLEVNRRYEEILGVRRDNVVNQLATDVYGIRSAPYLTEYAAVVDSGTPVQFETYFPPMDKHFVISVASMGDDCFATIFFDITEQKKTERTVQQAKEALAKAERHYRLMFNSVSDAVFVHKFEENGLPSHFLEVNDNACRYLGYTREELLQMGPPDIDAPDEHVDFLVRVRNIRANGHWTWEGTHIAKDGQRIPVEVNTHLISIDGLQTLISSVRDISDRKEAEKNYRLVFDGALEGIFRTSLDGRGLLANPALAQMLGYDSVQQYLSEVTDSARQVWMDPNERSQYLKLLEQQEVVRGYQCQLKRRDGNAVWVSLNCRKVCGLDGQPLYTEGFIEDITERKRMQDALRKSAETLAKVFRSSPTTTMLFKLVDTEYRVADVNESFEQATGYRREEAVGRTMEGLGLWVDHSEGIEYMKQFRASGRVRSFEHRFRRNNGEIGVCLSSAESIEIDGLPYAIAATIDITKQKQVEVTMRSLVTAIEQSADTIVITDLNGIIQYCNPAFSKVTGYSIEEAIGQNPRLLKSGKHSTEFYQQMWASIMQGNVWTGHMINKRKDGSFYEEDATISPIRDTSGKLSGFVAVKRDVTERLQLEDRLRQAQKLESVGRLAGGVAHDFNNLLTVINGYSEFLLKGLNADDPLRSYADEIKTAGERAASLTKQLLAFSCKQVIEPKVLDLNAVIRSSATMLQRLIGDDVQLETHLDGLLGQVMADPDQIHQVIMNLAVNARDAMPDGGALDMETLNVELTGEDGSAGHPVGNPGRYVLMTVTDTGHGMNETIQKEIFEPFFTTKEAGRGTGLGLSTVYGIIRQNGGWIDVWSEVGVGTAFRIYLPRIDACPVADQKGLSAPSQGGGETILVVEDQKAVRSFAKAALRQHGYHVIDACDGGEALSVAKECSEQIHLLLTDVIMPGLNGRELCDRLKELRPTLKVLFISGYTADVIANRGVLDPGIAFLHKPFSQEELARKVREVLDDPLR